MSGAPIRLKKIAVLVSVGLHPVSRTARYSRNDAAALALAQKLAAAHGATLDVLHAGDAGNPALADYLALGAPRVEVLPAEPDAEVVPQLAARVAGYDIVLSGMRAEGAFDSGLLPYALAESLGYPIVADALEIDVADGELRVRQFLPKGLRRRVALRVPAVVAVHPLAPATIRYAYARQRAGRIVPSAPATTAAEAQAAMSVATATRAATVAGADTTAIAGGAAAVWQVGPATQRPKKLAAIEKRSGHARMVSATVAESRGGRVVIEGTSVEKAKVVLAYLREHQLIDY